MYFGTLKENLKMASLVNRLFAPYSYEAHCNSLSGELIRGWESPEAPRYDIIPILKSQYDLIVV